MAGYNNYFPQTYTNSPYVYSAAGQPGVSWAQPTTTSSQLTDGREDKYVTHEELNKILAELKGEPKEEKKNEPQFLI